MKKICLFLIITISLTCSSFVNVHAYNFPNSFWKINDAYLLAVEQNDSKTIIEYGLQAIELMLTQPQNEDSVLSVIADRSQKLANVYAELGMYDKSAEMFEFFIPYGEKKGWEDSVLIARSKIPQYKSTITLYTDNGTSPYFGAKNEPQNGMLFGVIATSPTRELIPTETSVLMYHELAQEPISDIDGIMQNASGMGLTVEFALNCPGEGYDIANFESKKFDIENISNKLKKYSDVPVLLRFGAEFNVWTTLPDTEQFKEVFRYVSTYFKNNNPNVAMVWSPNAISAWGMDMNDYYPGDEYVDWVGVSLYLNKYFGANPNSPEFEETYFKTGDNANPILIMEEVIAKYGDRKPIMISESGQSAYINSSYVSEDTTEWAVQKMKEMYNYLPMVYPQIKFIAHFDNYVNSESYNYCLTSNPTLQKQYIKETSSPRFIKNGNENAMICYQPIYDNICTDELLPISCYAQIYKDSVAKVDYYIDNIYSASSNILPFSACLDLTNVTSGLHTLKAIITTNNGQVIEKEHTLKVSSSNDITVTVNGTKIQFDQSPTLHNDRTMVPLRAIFEALGVNVSWDADSQKVTATKGNDVVEFVINSDSLNKNGAPVYLDVPAMLVGNRTLVPVRAIAESFDCNVAWDEITQTVIITK